MGDFQRIEPYPINAPPPQRSPLIPSLLCALFVCAGVIVGLYARPHPPDVHIFVGTSAGTELVGTAVTTSLASTPMLNDVPTLPPPPTQDPLLSLPYCSPALPDYTPCVPLIFATPVSAAIATPTLPVCQPQDYRISSIFMEPCLKAPVGTPVPSGTGAGGRQ